MAQHHLEHALDALGGDRKKIKVVDTGDAQEIVGPLGTKLCRGIEVQVVSIVTEAVGPHAAICGYAAVQCA